MAISDQISRLQADRNTIRASLVDLGMATGTDNLTTLANAIKGITNQGAVSIELKAGNNYYIPKGYHNGGGVVTAISNDESEAEKYKKHAKTVTPTKLQQIVTPNDGYWGLESVTVAAIPDIYQDVSSVTAAAGDVLTGKIFVTADGKVITGTMANNGTVTKQLDTTAVTYTIPAGYHKGDGKVSITLETKTVTPTKTVQDITPTDGKVLSKVTVAAIPDKYVDTTDATAAAAYILDGKTAYVNGTKIEGTMANNGSATMSMDGITKTSLTIPAGYTSGGTISLTSDIEDALAAI